MRKKFLLGLCLIVGSACSLAKAADHSRLTNPVSGVVCDAYFCADAAGVSDALTTKYLGAKKGKLLAAQGEFDRTAFTFANGIYCDTKEKVCRKDRYFGADGKPSGKIDSKTTQWLFAQ
ncbi:YcgJ family protein [Klebsiella michiganensis]|uniref:YcgJ family protein n=1 Tax=Klebsiella michiganensis TaxID=1134687 RepID=UPI003F4F9D41